jgi:16S rRNA (cytosine967-C5)-methyltransferase
MTQARHMAVDVLFRVLSAKQTLDHHLSLHNRKIERLNRADRALFHAIVYGVLRWQTRLDWTIDNLASRPGKKIDPLVRIILRMGVFQIDFLERVPNSAAVNTCVELTKIKRRAWASGFVNRLLRLATDKSKATPWPDRRRDPKSHLAIRYAFPRWLISRWVVQFGIDETDALCKAVNTVAPTTIRTNTLKVDRGRLIEHIQTEAKGISITAHSPDGVSFSSLHRPLARWDAYQKGWFQVQGEASQCIGRLLAPSPGHRVWDACAGLGTKTAHMAQLMKGKGYILASDLSSTKLDRLAVEMHRLGITTVEPLRIDLTRPPAGWHPGPFDRILVDAPCTGLGVLQKNPDGKWRIDPKIVQSNGLRQVTLLDKAAAYLKPSGIMVYAVCSIEPEENEQVIQAFLQKHPEFAIDYPKLDDVHNSQEFLTSEGFVKTIPHRHQMGGFFAAVLKKSHETPN